jgi:TPR repeat protein
MTILKTAFLLLAVSFSINGAYAQSLKKGMTAWYQGDPETAILHLQPLADAGDPRAQLTIGRMHARGAGFNKNNAVAAIWFAMAARQGHIEAQIELAEKFLSGTNGLPQNFEAAAKWFEIAAERGLAEAQFKLGQLYAEGRGVKQNFVAAHIWFNLAAAQGYLGAAAKRSLVSLKLTSRQISQAQEQAGRWVKKVSTNISDGRPPDTPDLNSPLHLDRAPHTGIGFGKGTKQRLLIHGTGGHHAITGNHAHHRRGDTHP